MGWLFFRSGWIAALMLPLSVTAASGIPDAGRETAIEQDEAVALTRMATQYEHAEGVARDYQQASNLYCRAARMGRAEAQYRLGWMYANGRGVPRDDGVAAALFAMAAAQGHEQSKRILFYVRPKSLTTLPACLLVAEWAPSLKLSRELSAPENVSAASNPYQHSQESPTSLPDMQAAR